MPTERLVLLLGVILGAVAVIVGLVILLSPVTSASGYDCGNPVSPKTSQAAQHAASCRAALSGQALAGWTTAIVGGIVGAAGAVALAGRREERTATT
ncbi:hypothetical protein [Amycolatopsis nigrescens]|uniref:hypothetical protein n=1 Tax=Amycolatopsis nigrescens TaxID=381445 RepID=UPI000365A3D5|nr:hypothetical protein [Amycolatopsis nigrescens]